ncbi:sugar ABC transporter permease [Pectobacteriaceae bacterium CE70]|uniref:Sugar ABC transporter permease n=1 Tax=Serratia sp. (strain ATCC 39006) TaxID=104623 RepID=A0A2I5T5Q9_SERS3|nr:MULTISPECIES: sugar ABC transporter permease [Enterobacterales]WJV61591.1 sugar ABC transporter permease [Pectobacteriaceae bacterium C52]WJV65866.1 sugar ABC transporter permease [Pectobacteriaceae bacterium CE70]WJY09885.1 sugar ABC transporter permease [Pectobacteriaceae bacterium C80]AUG99885.1 sugar ABC transporter permease [Serratia sp. ATCC 39006]AUH04205.1 sugar ABC transporter permease [Serratia sp. ATCC 39006]
MLNKSRMRNLLFILPSMTLYTVFLLLPLVFSLWASFTAWDGTSWPIFVGLQNFAHMFADATFWISISNNALLLLFYTLFPIIVGLILCSFLNDTRSGVERSLLRILFFLPYIMPMAVLGVVWRWLYNPAFGPIDQILRAMGQSWLALSWLGDFDWALPAVGLVATWYFFGFCLVLFMAGLQRMDPSLLEAAELDGSSRRQKFMRITLPALRPEIRVATLLTVIAGIKAFDLVYVMTHGGPGTSTLVTNIYMYQQGFDLHHFGYASAVAIIGMVMVFILNGLIHLVLRERH